MTESMQIISQRIIQAARLAVASHLYASADTEELRQPIKIASSGPRFFGHSAQLIASRRPRAYSDAGSAE